MTPLLQTLSLSSPHSDPHADGSCFCVLLRAEITCDVSFVRAHRILPDTPSWIGVNEVRVLQPRREPARSQQEGGFGWPSGRSRKTEAPGSRREAELTRTDGQGIWEDWGRG